MGNRFALRLVAVLIPIFLFYSACSNDSQTMEEAPEGMIMTVRGPIDASNFGKALMHEHLVGSFTLSDENTVYDREHAIRMILPHLQGLRFRGYTGLGEASTVDMGRDLVAIYRLSQLSDMHIVVCTGYYGARNDRMFYPFVFEETAEQIADRWVRDWEDGMGDLKIKPGFIKIGVDPKPRSEVDIKLVRAAALAHLRTGLMIHIHCGRSGTDLVDIVEEEGVDPSAVVIIHAASIPTHTGKYPEILEIAERGSWLSLDGVGLFLGDRQMDGIAQTVVSLIEAGHIDNITISHDHGWYDTNANLSGGSYEVGFYFHPYELASERYGCGYYKIHDEFLPILQENGVTVEEIRKLLVINAAKVFTIGVRKFEG